jgi:hypothetical protein
MSGKRQQIQYSLALEPVERSRIATVAQPLAEMLEAEPAVEVA